MTNFLNAGTGSARSLAAGLAGGLLAVGVVGAAGLAASAPGSVPRSETGLPAVVEAEQPIRMSADEAADLDFARRLSSAFKNAAKRVEQAVVHITTEQTRQRVLGRDRFGRRVVSEPEEVQTGLGSGVIIDAAEGIIVTNNHVVEDGDRLVVRLYDGREVVAEQIGADNLADLAVLRIDAEDLVEAPFGDSDRLDVGEWVLALGSPFGFSNTVTAGIVSAKGRTQVGSPSDNSIYQEFIQTDASINPGNSGGPLIDLEGRIVGINTAIASRGGGSNGIGFAIPAAVVEGVVDLIRRYGRVERGYLGVSFAELAAEESRSLGLQPGIGIRIARVLDDTPAEMAGLRDGDVLLAVNDRPIEGLGEDVINRARNIISLVAPGEPVKLDVLRDKNEVVTLSAELADAATGFMRSLADRWNGTPLYELGVVVIEMTPEISKELRYLRPIEGELILYVQPESPAARAGLRREDILLERDERIRRGQVLQQLEILRGTERGSIEIPMSED
ncbi:MAG: trypsin-like peptidase domain-containing protein [Planctomycetota bacterium]